MNVKDHAESRPYSMERDGESAEITLYGEIVETRPVDFWTGETVPGEFIVQGDFMADLEALGDIKSLTLRMNSIGGDAGVSLLIHNRLRELAENGVSLACVVDGVAMSGGSLIMCACDRVEVNPSSIIMIHKCWDSLMGAYNADDLRRETERCEAWDRAQVSVYNRKTGLSKQKIENMMARTTYMTGSEAVQKGFADALLDGAEPLNIAASADRRSLYVGGRRIRMPPGALCPDTFPVVETGADAPEETKPENDEQMGGKAMEKDKEKRRGENPTPDSKEPGTTAHMSVESAAPGAQDLIAAERKRIQEIDEMACFCDAETVQEAKYGPTACTAQEMLVRAARKAKQTGRSFLSSLEADTMDSGAMKVSASPGTNGQDLPAAGGGQNRQDVRAAARSAVARYLAMKEGKAQ